MHLMPTGEQRVSHRISKDRTIWRNQTKRKLQLNRTLSQLNGPVPTLNDAKIFITTLEELDVLPNQYLVLGESLVVARQIQAQGKAPGEATNGSGRAPVTGGMLGRSRDLAAP
jgi:hypothetical protein